MTDTKTETIIEAVKALLDTLTGITVYRSRVDALSRRQASALNIVQRQNAPSTTPVTTCKIEWVLTLDLEFYFRGDIPDSIASPFIEAAYALLMADRSLGGLAINVWPGIQQPQIDPTDGGSLWMVCPFDITYRTTQESMAI
jgi:hypothetical protein